ncbi:MAG: TonB-dependent receptor [Alphaproteobacteria bacterium]|nr:MAG: TonB-dependent receptor [Alphaproteobacteria bacterium]
MSVKQSSSFRSILSTTSLVAAFLGPVAFANAQQAGDEVLEEIVTTATQRQQTVQDVPIAVSAFGADELQRAGVTDLRDLTNIAPSLFLTSSQSEVAGAVARIRGIGTTGDNSGLESAVAVFIDGVYRNRTNNALTELGAVERIEVLRGPQGTLFGRNASAGLISITTKQPTYEFEGYGEISYGNYDAVRIGAGLSGPLVENKLAARIDGVYFERDGFIEDKVTGEDYNDRDRFLIRGQLLADPSEDLSLRLIFDYSEREENCCAAVVIVPSAVSNAMIGVLGAQFGSGALPGEDPFDRRSATSEGRGFQQDAEEWGLSLQADWSTSIGELTSITAFRNWKSWRSQDIDYTSLDIAFRDEDGFVQEFETFSQEIRLNGQWGKLDWLVGAYFADEDLAFDDAIRFGRDFTAFADLLVDLADGIPGNGLTAGGAPWPGYNALAALVSGGAIPVAFPEGFGVVQDMFRQNSENWALFTHNIYALSETVDLSVGLRYTEERKTVDARVVTNNPTCLALVQAAGLGAIPASLTTLPCAPFWSPLLDVEGSDKRKEERLTGTVALNFTVTDNLSTYGSYSRGYKGGGFNLDRAGMIQGAPDPSQLQFEEEVVDSFELGAKYRSSDRKLVVNTALFYSDFSDFQLNAFNGTSFVVVNLPKAETYGVEIESQWLPIAYLSLAGGLTYAKTEYGSDFAGPEFAPPSPGNPLGGAFWQLPGNTLTNAPRWSITGSATWQQPIGDGFELLVHLDGRYTSKVNTGSDLDLEKEQDGVFLLNGRIGVGEIDGRWQVELWGRNLLDKDYIQVAFDGPLQGSGTRANTIAPNTQVYNAFLAEPRTYGITLRGRF